MDLDRIEKLMRMLEQSDLQELEVLDGDTRIRLAKRRTLGLDDAADGPEPEAAPARLEAAGPHRIVAGLTGTFYRSSAPGVQPYVSEGSTVTDGQRVALIEAMKVFNPVECDVGGTVVRVLAEDGALVTPGTPLFEIEPA